VWPYSGGEVAIRERERGTAEGLTSEGGKKGGDPKWEEGCMKGDSKNHEIWSVRFGGLVRQTLDSTYRGIKKGEIVKLRTSAPADRSVPPEQPQKGKVPPFQIRGIYHKNYGLRWGAGDKRVVGTA